MLTLIFTLLLLVPPVVIAAFWRSSVLRRRRHRGQGGLPDPEIVVLARLEGIACALLPIVQLLAGVIRYKTGEIGTFLWFVLPGFGVLLAFAALATFLDSARGYERLVSPGMVLVSTSMLLLLTLVDLLPAS